MQQLHGNLPHNLAGSGHSTALPASQWVTPDWAQWSTARKSRSQRTQRSADAAVASSAKQAIFPFSTDTGRELRFLTGDKLLIQRPHSRGERSRQRRNATSESSWLTPGPAALEGVTRNASAIMKLRTFSNRKARSLIAARTPCFFARNKITLHALSDKQ